MISVIVAIANDGVIGAGNDLIWHIPEDLKRFKAITSGHPVIMGRKTFESLGRPLPNRTNVVITRNRDYCPEGVVMAGSLEEALALFPAEEEVFIIGGGEIYRQSMPLADKFYITEVHADYEGDTYFPEWDRAEWDEIFSENHRSGEKYDKPFTFKEYVRKR